MVVVLSLTQNGQDATRGPDEEAGPHGSRVQQHGLRGNEDARADDRPHDQADATEQTHLCQVGKQGREFVLVHVMLKVSGVISNTSVFPSLDSCGCRGEAATMQFL